MGKFTWTQIMAWEEASLKSRVPQNIPGLIPRDIGSNNRFLLRATGFERNGQSTLFNQLTLRRMALAGYVTFFCYQYLRMLTFGWTEYNEHHSQNKDDIVYDKLSARTVPYHYPAGVL